MTSSKVISVNVSRPRAFEHHGKSATSSIWKSPVENRVAVRGVNVEGDDQADRGVHGGPDKAVYSYALEDVRFWESEHSRSLELAALGENVTTEGLDVTNAVIGARWEIGSAEFEVSEPRVPCWKLAYRMEDPTFVRRFTKAGRPGAYLRIVREGEIAAGDEIRVLSTPAHGLSVGDVFRIYSRDRGDVKKLLDIPQLSESWRSWTERDLDGK